MFDRILRIGSTFDWISPTIAFIQDHLHGSGVDFILPDDTGWSGRQVEHLLKSKGIRLWGLMAIGSELLFTVSRRQAAYTQYWLERAGLPYQGGLAGGIVERPGLPQPSHPTQPPSGKARGRLDSFLDKLFEW